ncbi:MAG: hypothetical protein ACR2N3_14725 [Pyrinomonadaceae bacterium]
MLKKLMFKDALDGERGFPETEVLSTWQSEIAKTNGNDFSHAEIL